MSFVRDKLKLARDALGKKDYSGARDAAGQVLDYEPENYHANVFIGLAFLELGEHEKSEQAYHKAIDLNPEQPLAWQGISKAYERTEAWDKHASTLRRLIEIYSKADDAVKCAEICQKLIELCRGHGTRLQLVEALSLLLPDSSIYTVLSKLPPPDPTTALSTTYATQYAIHRSLPILEEIVGLLEAHESDTIKKEVEKRRMRLGASSPEQLKKEVGRELWGSSRLPLLYNEILNHPNTSDELRREVDSKLLRYKRQYLYALSDVGESASVKTAVLKELDELVNGAVILRIPDELAWMIFLESKDYDSMAVYDHTLIKQFVHLFPSSPITSLLHGYFNYMGTPLFDEEEDESAKVLEEDPFDIIVNAYSANPDSIIANRVLADVYLNELDYENAIKAAESGLEILLRAERNSGRRLPRVRIGFKIILATSLVHLFSPKYHPRALFLIDEVLSQSPDNVACMMGRAYILRDAKKWLEASALFARVNVLLPDNNYEGLRAKEENAWCLCQLDDVASGMFILKDVLEGLDDLDQRESDRARCLWRLGKCYWDMGDTKRDEAYHHFIAALKHDPAYAPAYTSLGIYYSDASSPDPTRASKCFQKAFELDPREADAARRLAEGFAEGREWDLVDVVARRTIDGEGGWDAGVTGAGAAMRYLPTNSWAWKAVGVVELNRRNYPLAIEAFQVALRAEQDDQLSWLRLGEAYSKAGRHIAAIKALGRAHDLQPNDWMCSYLIGDVKQQMGQFQDAIIVFELILLDRPLEIGVLISLGRAYLDLGRTELSDGFCARAEHSFVTCIRVNLRMIRQSPGFRGLAWKTMADAVFSLSERPTFIDEHSVRGALMEVISFIPAESDHLSSFMPPTSLQADTTLNGIKALEIAAAAYSYRLTLGEKGAGNGSVWFDLAITLHSWITKNSCDGNYEKASAMVIDCLTQALREDPGNDVYWVVLGDVNFLSHAKTAQHAYIKALEINSKSVAAWTNLGLLYIHYNDLELANEVLYRAQTLDPDYAMAWIGQALVATANEHEGEARAILEHAVSLAANLPQADLEFASRIFKEFRLTKYDKTTFSDTLLPAFFILGRYCERRPDDAAALHLLGLICENFGHLEIGVGFITRAIAILEAAYEEAEDPTIERHFTIASANLARLRLSLGDYQGAADSFESALGLLPEDGDPTTKVLRAQAQFGSGLVSFMQGDLGTALDFFGFALESDGDDLNVRGQVTVLLSQTMWAIQTDDFKERAKTQLLECVATDPENLTAINTLAGMGILTQDDNLVDAALSEILSLSLERRHQLDPQRDVNYLLIQHHLGRGDPVKAISIAQSALVGEPSHPDFRNGLATLALQTGKYGPAFAVLSGSTFDADNLQILPASLSLQAIARSLNGEDHYAALREAQRAIMLSPSNIRHWRALAYVRSRIE